MKTIAELYFASKIISAYTKCAAANVFYSLGGLINIDPIVRRHIKKDLVKSLRRTRNQFTVYVRSTQAN